jgi:Zn-dependent metalloprotease
MKLYGNDPLHSRFTERFDFNLEPIHVEDHTEESSCWHGHECHIIPPHIQQKLAQIDDEVSKTCVSERTKHHASQRFTKSIENQKISNEFRQKRLDPNNYGISEAERESIAKVTPHQSVLASVTVYNVNHLSGSRALARAKVIDPKYDDVTSARARSGALKTLQFYSEKFQRNSVDDKGFPLKSYVHYGKKYDNAFWDGRQMIYGDGDKRDFADFTIDPDIIGHELTHGITQYTTNLEYHDQPGALNEHISDVFGIMFKQYVLSQTTALSDWLIGENVMIDIAKVPFALRSMKAPGTAYVNHPDLGTDPQPDRFSGYYTGRDDNGGVHINSGIPNHAFYLTAEALGGFSWDKAGKIWYSTITALDDAKRPIVKPTASFADFAKTTIASARKIYGPGSIEESAVLKAWTATEVIGTKAV